MLVVGDNVDAAVTLATLLDIVGYETALAHDGHEALRQAEAFAPDDHHFVKPVDLDALTTLMASGPAPAPRR